MDNQLTKESLKEASEFMEKDQIDKAMQKIAIAFYQLTDDFERRKNVKGYEPFFFAESLHFPRNHFFEYDDKLKEFFNKVSISIGNLNYYLKIISLGLNYSKFVKFGLITPHVTEWVPNEDGKNYEAKEFHKDVKILTKEDYQFAYNFVIESALHLQESDFDIGDFLKKDPERLYDKIETE